MTRTRLIVVSVFLGSAAIIAFVGFTDSALTEWRVVWPLPLVVGLIALLTGRKGPPKATFSAADWKGADPALLHELGTLHGFSPAHLDANRAGLLHPEQQADGVALGRGDVRFGAVLLGIGQLILLAGFATQFFPRALKDFDFQFAWPEKLGVALTVGLLLGGFVGALPLLFGFVAFRYGREVVDVHRRGKVLVASGPLELLEVRRSRSGSSYHYVIANFRFAVGRTAWLAMAKKGGAAYRIYYVPVGGFRVLSIEPG